MSEKITNHEINEILRGASASLPDCEPHTIAVLAFRRIAEEARDEALIILLQNQLSRVYSYDRDPVPSRNEVRRSPGYVRPNSVAAVRDCGVSAGELDGTSFWPWHLTRSRQQRIWVRGKARNITQGQAKEQIDAEIEEESRKIDERLRASVAKMAEIQRRADIAEALDRRVMVRGRYKMLLDCTLEEVEWLAEKTTNTSIGHLHAAAFYTDVANRMREAGVDRVRLISHVAESAA